MRSFSYLLWNNRPGDSKSPTPEVKKWQAWQADPRDPVLPAVAIVKNRRARYGGIYPRRKAAPP